MDYEAWLQEITADTAAGKVQWTPGDAALQEWMEAAYGNFVELHIAGGTIGGELVYVSYQFYEGEIETDEWIRQGISVLKLDLAAGEILQEVTDEDVADPTVFEGLVQAIKGA